LPDEIGVGPQVKMGRLGTGHGAKLYRARFVDR